jgi:hypothetical protein
MTNTNCLEGIQCPACSNEDRFRIAGTSLFTVTDEGTEDHGDVEWDDGSYAECPECGRRGALKDFKADAAPADAGGYFRGASGRRYTYADVAERIRKEAPQTLGQHIFVQLEAIGLLEEFQGGTTPCGLPSSFACATRQVEKRLTSSGLVHTPGLFRALQTDYRIPGEPRRRAVRILSEGYGLPRDEAQGLLSGAIPIAIDEAAGTITYTSAAER